ncbi:uncharacterized protein (DUF1697 family) [Enterococcus sp. PF1-24]|uniref:DUF1697 domain-containing protein n=1 Tax=Enterococcus sp. PF1-24 TaxID=1742399 RepID=UPI00247602B3|nr:DUF1697 domain-containing protein [Enterococcus sp. PF1-24]MDH6363898.1 uncharacterized protein (DUF1697 family) [Enterococcus sp. PFB1-1]MDH6400916.1 uncharacterized protein (DUF1697 family) [Enterococcus sp. PF1-24]
MEKYIALLRGINVSGKNKIAMPELRKVFEEFGFTDVTSYINSGNVLFTTANQYKTDLIRKIETLITEKFMLEIPVTVVSTKELTATLAHAPAWWDIDKEAVNYAIFLIPPMDIATVFAAVGEIKPEYEQIDYHENVIFWTAPLKTFQKARWSKIASSAANNHVTIRNANTVNKLLKMAE